VSLLLQGGKALVDGAIRDADVVVAEGVFTWIGTSGHAPATDHVARLDGALLLPAFVDGHVHATDTGLTLAGLDLTGVRSKQGLLDAVAARTKDLRGRTILGHGWDETAWPDRSLPTADELDRAAYGSYVYLSRVDVHSALASGALMASVPGLAALDGFSTSGWLAREAHHAVRTAGLGSLSAAQRQEAHRIMLRTAAERGIAQVHEMAGPLISGEEDTRLLLELAASEEPLPEVVAYWGQLASEGGLETMRRLGAYGAAGDLFVDGAIGSRTACLHEPYRDDPTTQGAAYLDPEQIAHHIGACTEAGLQGGFHVIGDAASAAVTDGLRRAAARVGADAIRRAGHRVEHAEMLSDDDIAVLAEYSVTASVQPLFDALWGGFGGMYETRLGRDRAVTMNRFADLMTAGAPLAFSSDSPVTPIGPWAAVRAAMHHTSAEQRISGRAAFAAHTRGGWRAAGDLHAGVITPGAPAHLAIWQADEFEVRAPDTRVAGWSTDPRSGTPALPHLDGDAATPVCLATLVAGTPVFTADALPWT